MKIFSILAVSALISGVGLQTKGFSCEAIPVEVLNAFKIKVQEVLPGLTDNIKKYVAAYQDPSCRLTVDSKGNLAKIVKDSDELEAKIDDQLGILQSTLEELSKNYPQTGKEQVLNLLGVKEDVFSLFTSSDFRLYKYYSS